MSLFSRVLRSGEGKKVKALEALVPDINAVAERFAAMDDDGLRAMTGEFRQRLDRGEEIDDLLVEAFAVVREAGMQSRRARLPEVAPVAPVESLLNAAMAEPGGEVLDTDVDVLLVGPEGGWTPEELRERRRISLGSTILRAETAAIVAGALLVALRDGRVVEADRD